MANYQLLKADIDAKVYQNGAQEITGENLNSVLNAMVASLGVGYQFMGMATPINPGSAQTPDYKCFYLATTPGTYTNLGGLVVADGEVAILKYDTSWTKEVTGIATAESVSQLGQIWTDVNGQIRPFVEKLTGFTISNGKWMEGVNYNSAYYPISKDDTLIIKPTSNKAYITIVDDVPTPVNGASVNFASGYSGYLEKSVDSTIVVPNDGKYLVFLINASATNYTPASIIINGVDVLKSIQKINEENAQPIEWASEIKPFIKKSINLFDNTAADITYGSYIQGGNLNTDAGYNISGYIPVSPSSQYSHKVYPSYFGITANRVSCYDKDKNYINYALGVVTDGINVFTPLADTAFVRVNVAVGDMDTYMFVSGTTYPSIFVPYGIYTEHLDTNRFSPLWGKKLCCDGDSIMHGAAQGGVSNGGFALPIAEKFNMTLQNIAVPGGTIRSDTYWDADQQNPRHWICNSLATLDADGDYYIFEGGVNDVGSSAVMGSISWGYSASLDTTTFCGAFEKCCKTLVETFKGKKCGFVFVHRIWQPTDTLASSFFENQKAILKKWGIPFIDLMELAPALNLIDDLKSTYTNNADGWHPNKLGYATYYVPKIIAWLETL